MTYCGNKENLDDIENNSNYTFIHGNICDKKLVDKIMETVEVVVNFAAETHVDNSIMSPEIFIKTNVEGTLNLLQGARKYNIKKFLQVSTDEVYGSLDEEGCFTEDSPIAPNSPYSASKASADMLVRAYNKTYGVPTVITRCSNNYGPYQYPEKLIPLSISKLLKNEKIPVYGNGENIRDWIYVYDHCEAIDLVLHKGKIGEVYNIGSNNEKSNIEIIKIILDTLNMDDSYIEFVQDRAGHDKRYSICNKKIVSEFGWEPKMEFKKGMEETINWYINHFQ